MRHHGGDITLSRMPRGLKATIALPRSHRGL
ncbi:hypothetical protein [Sinorhizobium medicae]